MIEKQLMEGVMVKLEGGKLSLEADFGLMLVPKLDALVAKFESGEIDIVKGTDLDKSAALILLANIKAELLK